MIFALSMGEYGIVLLITPPGYQMLTIKIYNYLHYGSSDVVFALNLFVFLLVVAVAASMVLIYSVKTGEKGT
jgi:iron(III) transport system permease protein